MSATGFTTPCNTQKRPWRLLKSSFFFLLFALILASCAQSDNEPLPVLGRPTFVNGDSIPHTIPDFSFIDQDSQVVDNETFAGKAYVVDFFFTSCPTICPKTTAQMFRIYKKFENNDGLVLLAHSIDTKYDSVPVLKKYASKLGVKTNKWHFVTGEKDAIYGIADDYFSIAIEDPNSPGGYDHSGRLILIDKNRHIRSFCDGTDAKDVDRFMKDIQKLLDEK